MKPKMFVGSSSESKPVAHYLQSLLLAKDLCDVTVWDQDVFRPSATVFGQLNQLLDDYDFAVFVFNRDDDAIIRNRKQPIVRDNVIFEHGLFMGGLGSGRVFIVTPILEKKSRVRMPSDLAGVVTLNYSLNQYKANGRT